MSIFSSDKPDDVTWRTEQGYAHAAISGIARNRADEAFMADLKEKGYTIEQYLEALAKRIKAESAEKKQVC